MAQTYDQIQKQIESLQRQAEALRSAEVAEVVERIKVAIAHYGLTAEQLGLSASNRGSKARARVAKAVRYSNGAGGTWGGRGKRPDWLREALEQGRKLEEFLVDARKDGIEAIAPMKGRGRRRSTNKARKLTNTARTSYRDQAGNTWSGMGPKPKWLKEALATGTPLADMAVVAT